MSNINEETETKKVTKIGDKVISKLEPAIFKILKQFNIPNDVVVQQLTLLGAFGTKTGKISLYNDIHENDIEYMNVIKSLYEEHKSSKAKPKKSKTKKEENSATESDKSEEVITSTEPEKVNVATDSTEILKAEESAAFIEPEKVDVDVDVDESSKKKKTKKTKKTSKEEASIEA